MSDGAYVEIAGRQLVCPHCEGTRFNQRRARLSAVLDWSEDGGEVPESGVLYVCAGCSRGELFMGSGAAAGRRASRASTELEAIPVLDDTCLDCGAILPISAHTCIECGWTFAAPPPPPEAIEPVPAEPRADDRPPPDRSDRCPHCNVARRPGALICSSCGRIYGSPDRTIGPAGLPPGRPPCYEGRPEASR